MDDYDGEGMFDDEEGNENEGFEVRCRFENAVCSGLESPAP